MFECIDLLDKKFEVYTFDTDIHGFPINYHWHYFAEILFIIEGEIIVEVDNESRELHKGEFIFIPPRAVHAITKNNSNRAHYDVLKFSINHLALGGDVNFKLRGMLLGECDCIKNYIVLDKDDLSVINIIINNIEIEIKEKNIGHESVVINLISILIVELFRVWENKNKIKICVNKNIKENSFFQNILEFIDSHLGDKICIEELARKCNMSYSNFTIKFKYYFGKSCKDYILHFRVLKAVELLKYTDFDLNFIAYETGFSDCSHFIKTYKKIRGITPSMERKKFRNK